MHATATPERETHSIVVGYLCWLLGFMGFHRFYFGKQITGTIWFFTLGVLFVGWLVDLFLIPGMHASAERRYRAGPLDYNVAWLLLTFLAPWAPIGSISANGSRASSGCSPADSSELAFCTTCGRSMVK